MEPPRPKKIEELLALNPAASPADVEEYERLLAARFQRDPDAAAQPTLQAAADENRLQELFTLLYPPKRATRPAAKRRPAAKAKPTPPKKTPPGKPKRPTKRR